MDKIKKLLRKHSRKTQLILQAIFKDVLSGKIEEYDVVKLSGMKNIYRLRKGDFRIVFKIDKKNIEIIRVVTRDDKTYKGL
jgi:mRNA-degrading endonuclease RelE of RelBE toxin-antitoxin system